MSPCRTQQQQSQSDERITVISITPNPLTPHQNNRPDQKRKSSLKQQSQASRFSDQAGAQYSDYSSPSRSGRVREMSASEESNLEEYQIEGGSGLLGHTVGQINPSPPSDIEREIQRKTPETDQHYRGGGVNNSGNRR